MGWVCAWCNEQLVLGPRGLTHRDGSVYKQRARVVYVCEDLNRRTRDEALAMAWIQAGYEVDRHIELVDDHCVLPVRS